jgi:hypothetical protein
MKTKPLPVFIVIEFMLCNLSIAQQLPYHPLRIHNNITLDGKLSEPEWQQAEVENDFMQYDPTAGAEPTEKTEARLLYNDEYLYVGLRAFDHHPDQLVRYSLQRDFEITHDDGFALAIDMYNDKNTGLAFINNILNARWDAELSSDGAVSNEFYNTFWDVASQIDSLGYTTEFRIPFSSLRFEAKDTVRMGFRIVRLKKRLNETTIVPRSDPKIEDAYFKLSLSREMEFYHLKSRKPFYITPYIIVNYVEENVLNPMTSGYQKQSSFISGKNYLKNKTLDKIISNIGFDIKYGITKNFTLDITANTDFAQAEADNVIVNLTKYEVNLPERRSFFLESQNYLSYTTTTSNELFISRSIGLEHNAIVPIICGIRLTGKSHGWQVGLLDMETKKIDDQQIYAHNIFALRVRKDIDAIGSFAGGIITNLLNTSNNDSSFQSFGFGIVKKLNEQVVTVGSIAGTLADGNFKKISEGMNFNGGIFRTAKQGWYYGADIDYLGKNFSPSLGYVQENDLLHARGDLGYKWQAKEESKKASYYLHTNLRYKWKPDLKKEETKFANTEAGINFKNGATIEITPFEYWTDVLFENWKLTDHITIPIASYKMFSPDIAYTTPQKSKYHGELFVKILDFYRGHRITIQPNLTYVFNKHLNARIEYEYHRIKFPIEFSDNGSSLFQSNLLRLIVSYYFSSTLSCKLLSQFDQLNHSISSNLRFRYNPREGTDLYIVFNQGVNSNTSRLTPHLPIVNNQALIIKFLKTFTL